MIKPKIKKISNRYYWTEDLPENQGNIYNFEFIEDKQGFWVSSMYVDEEYQRKGIATEIIILAIKKYGKILFSNLEHGNQENYDKRYLTNEGQRFVESLLKKGIITSEEYCIPQL